MNNLEIKKIKYINLLGFLTYKLKKNNKKNFSKTFSIFQLKVINLFLPIISLIDKINIFNKGLSLIIVVKKK